MANIESKRACQVSTFCAVIVLIIVLFWCLGCTSKIAARSFCVPESIYCAWVWGVQRKTDVRIAVQRLRPGVDHCQAEALVDGKWTPLTPHWNEIEGRIAVGPWKRHFPVEPYRYLTLKEWIDEQIRFLKK